MKNAFSEALAANDLPKVRNLLIETIRNESNQTAPIETVTEVLETTPGLFDEDNGKTYAPTAQEMTPALTAQLIEDLKSNFSLEKFKLLTEVYALRVGQTPLEQSVEEALNEDSPATDEGKNEADDEAYRKPVGKGGRMLGAVFMILGVAAAIVGLCVPVKFLLGLGIGVFMLGTALLYTNLIKKD